MSFGFFGIQFGWALQMTNTSAIYEYLGASPEDIPILWLAAPLSGLIAQPIIGYMSDRTWTRLGRRRPYFLVGAIFSSLALIAMPNASSLWIAAGLLWILDTSINISMEPFRAFVADVAPDEQRTKGFAMQAFFIGSGAVFAALAPWILNNLFQIDASSQGGATVPLTVKLAFYIGAAVFLGTVLWTIFTTPESPPKDVQAFYKRVERTGGLLNAAQSIWHSIIETPSTMKQLAGVQFFSWLGMFCLFLYLPTAIAHHVFGAVQENSEIYTQGIEWAGICTAVYNGVCFIFSLFLSRLTELTNRKLTHAVCLIIGGLSLISLISIHDQYLILLPMVGLGIAWASILAIPYSLLSDALPDKKMGIYMGLFNAFIVIPQIVAALGLGWVVANLFDRDRLLVVVLGGFSFLLAACLMPLVKDEVSAGDKASEALKQEQLV
ncbi:MAG: SLC45 family MFS transporter [Spirulinaceae cyanobacterium RM2_2_10]|nr:SLC45 family MFS transporter [Spirulinaceae cyanobacterium SM2_1_0]NJO19644.1 SLC45 family MFS transporter [Spirulinaceae cyanobacterium RM2_2_10]